MKRILLFLATNLAVIAVLSVVLRVTGLDRWLAVQLHMGSPAYLAKLVSLARRHGAR